MLTRRAVTCVQIHYTVEGRGEPVLLIPGLGMSSVRAPWGLWGPGGPVVRPPADPCRPPRLGASDTPDVPYTGDLVAADMAAVLDDVGVDSAHVVARACRWAA